MLLKKASKTLPSMTGTVTALWFLEPNHPMETGKRPPPSSVRHTFSNSTHLPVFTAVGPHQCDRTSALWAQCDACSSSSHSTAACPQFHKQHKGLIQGLKERTYTLYKSVQLIALSGAKCDTIWRHKNTLIPSMGNVSANPPTSFAIQWDYKLVEFSSPCCSNYSSMNSTKQRPFPLSFGSFFPQSLRF